MQTFTWSHHYDAQGTADFRVLVAKFGDGYAQRAPDGLNGKQQTWPLQFIGTREKIITIRDFIDSHEGYKAFLWTPPLGVQGAYIASSYQIRKLGGVVHSLNVTFTESNRP